MIVLAAAVALAFRRGGAGIGTGVQQLQGALDPASEIPMIGASGAVSGILGAYILLHPGATIRVFVFLGVFMTITHIPALIVLGVWFGGQLLSAASAPPGDVKMQIVLPQQG